MHILIALLIYPIISLVFVWATRNRQTLHKKAAITITAVSMIMLAGYYLDISTINTELDLMLTTAPYLLLSILLWWAVFYFKKYLKVIPMTLALLILGAGYFIGIMGSLGILLATETPNRVITFNDGLVFKATSIGNAISKHRGIKLEVFRVFPWAPIFEKRLTKRVHTQRIVRYMRSWEVINDSKHQQIIVCIEEMHDPPALYWYDTIKLKEY